MKHENLIELVRFLADNHSYMWAAKSLGLIFDCDFRDSLSPAKDFLEKWES